MSKIQSSGIRMPRIRGRRRSAPRTLLVLSISWIALMVMLALIPQLIAPHDPLAHNIEHTLAAPSADYWFGTDDLGRDVLSRMIWGARPALAGIAIAVITATVVGVLWGLSAGYIGGIFDNVFMRVADVFLALPGVIFALAVAAALGPNLVNTMGAVGVSFAPTVARIMRAEVLSIRRKDYVVVCKMYGYSGGYRMFVHVLPNAFSPVLVQITILSGLALIAQTGLGFLGIGVNPPEPNWGASLSESFRYVAVSPQASIVPGLMVTLTVLALFNIGDRIRDRFAALAR